uniref:ZP domain-containing protein n=1 Tax=Parastrongyloides trichosuri TaxID=131310 RepID=A0A0N4Z0C2_PARTI
MIYKLLYLLLIIGKTCQSVSIDNEIIGEPDIECLQDEIRVWVKTRKPFAGRIYTKGKADLPECAQDDYSSQKTKKPHFSLGFGNCGMKSLRSLEPRGMYYGVTVVVSFHPMFITKVDQAFHVKCFFEEANKGLNAGLDVSMMPTTEIEARHGIPGCTYSIHKSSIDDLDKGRPAGQAIQFARIGDKVLHQWHCDDQAYGILINNCYVTDGFGKKASVIDSKGCPVDPILVTGIRYSNDLQRGYAESQVFKFADKPGVWFFCQIQMCLKSNGMCRGITPPTCSGIVSVTEEKYNGGEEKYNGGEKTAPLKSLETSVDYFEHEKGKNKKIEGYLSKDGGSATQTDEEEYDYDGGNNSRNYKSKKEQDLSKLTYNNVGKTKESGSLVKQTDVTAIYEARDDLERTTIGINRNLFTTTVTQPNIIHGDHIFSTTSTSSSQESMEDNNFGMEMFTTKDATSVVDKARRRMFAHGVPIHFKKVFDRIENSKENILQTSIEDRRALMDGFHDLLHQMKARKNEGVSSESSNSYETTSSQENIQNYKHRRIGKLKDKSEEYKKDIYVPSSPPYRPTRNLQYPETAALKRNQESIDDVPMISGQLMIYELDEEPPVVTDTLSQNNNNLSNIIHSNDNLKDDYILSRSGILGISLIVSVLLLLFLTIILSLMIKLKRYQNKYKKLLTSKKESSTKYLYTPSESSFGSGDFFDKNYFNGNNDPSNSEPNQRRNDIEVINNNNNRKFLTDFIVTKYNKNVC